MTQMLETERVRERKREERKRRKQKEKGRFFMKRRTVELVKRELVRAK